MTEAEIEIILGRAKEKYPEAKPRTISDNGPEFIAKDFKETQRADKNNKETDILPLQRTGSQACRRRAATL